MAKENAKPDETEVAPERPRERIVACAQELFHRHGIRGVGVETIAEAAGTNKMTLYRHFGSKDDLIVEYLGRKGRKAEEIWADVEAASPGDPVGQLYGYVGRVAKFIAEDERGCDLANAAVELTEAGHPGLKVIEEFKKRQRGRLARLCKAAGASQPAEPGPMQLPADITDFTGRDVHVEQLCRLLSVGRSDDNPGAVPVAGGAI